MKSELREGWGTPSTAFLPARVRGTTYRYIKLIFSVQKNSEY